MSTTDRFNDLEKRHPNVRILNPEKFKKGTDESILSNSLMKGINTSVKITDRITYDFKDTRTEWTRQERANDYETYTGKFIGFDQTSPRFNFNQVFFGQSLKFDVPGPGQYQANRQDMAFTSKPRNRNKIMTQVSQRPQSIQ